MLPVNPRKGPSRIPGLGLIAREFVLRGTRVWEVRPRFDLTIPDADLSGFPPPVREQGDSYCCLNERDDRFVIHATDPYGGVSGDRALVALRDIRFGEVVQYDYSTTMREEMWTMVCGCGQPACRGVVEDFSHLTAATRERYLRLGVVQRFVVDRWRESPA